MFRWIRSGAGARGPDARSNGIDRREVLRFGGVSAAGAALATIVSASPAGAAGGRKPVLRTGLATVPSGEQSVTVNVPGVSETSGGIAMTQGPGALTGGVVVDPATETMEIFLIGVRDFDITVGWLAFL
jgi:hypothetical protein